MATTSHVTRPDAAGDDYRTVAVGRGRDRRLAYCEYGRSDGSAVLFLHGTPGSRRLGSLLDAAARDHGVRLLAVDRPGYGRSDAWPDRSIRDAGRVVTSVLDDVGVETAGLVAFSGGAPHALATAATDPERVTRVDLLSGATPPERSDHTPAVQRLLGRLAATTPTVLAGLFRGQAWLADRLDPSFVVGQYTAEPESVPDDAAATVRADFVEAVAGDGRGAVTEFRQAATDWGIRYGDLSVPVRLWHGANDTNVPVEGARRLAAAIPTARLTVSDDADHLGTLLRTGPDALAAHR
ncbi:alpha/beta fold hydrolase [Haloarcula litorea]|uniref:alpha/beta fold hydrolase n=1 Tax=Haloarcula litorea TaxID=3032579 RepID=UPI0023E86A0F|nr:alpha/beta hydrolase [Halomicroarcula sp. GDY20]